MKHLTHIVAIVITIVCAVLFLLLKELNGWDFGFRTYWPAFVCLYLVVWYIAENLKQKSEFG